MIKLREITDVSEFKHDMTIFSVDHDGYKCLEFVACIDNGKMHTTDPVDGVDFVVEELETYWERYEAAYEVLG